MHLSYCLLTLGALFSLGQTQVLKAKEGKEHSKPTINIGRFNITIDDDRLNLTGVEANQTLKKHLERVWQESWKYWQVENHVHEDEQAHHSAELVQTYLDPNERGYFDYLNETTLEYLHHHRYDYDKNEEDHLVYDYSWYFEDVVWNLTQSIEIHRLAAYVGVGKSVRCSAMIEEAMEGLSEWEKAGSSAAITVMALLPTFLAFGNLYVPRSSEVFATSLLVGLSCAVYSLGLPVKSISAIRDRSHITIQGFGLSVQRAIAKLSITNHLSSGGQKPVGSDAPDLEELQSWTDEEAKDEAKSQFGRIRSEVDKWTERIHWWNIPAFLVAAAQVIMFALAIAPLLFTLGAPRFIFNCGENWTGYYLAASASINAVFRLFMWECGYHERVKIYALSERARAELSALVNRTSSLPSSKTTVDELPPLYSPFLERIVSTIRFVGRLFYRPGQASERTPTHDFAATTRASRTKWQGRIKFIFTNPKDTLKAGLSGLSVNSSAPRWRPLIVLIHLARDGRSLFFILFTGFVEALLLLILTFFFAAQWGGNLYVTGIALLLLLVFITAGRVLGVLYVMLSGRV